MGSRRMVGPILVGRWNPSVGHQALLCCNGVHVIAKVFLEDFQIS